MRVVCAYCQAIIKEDDGQGGLDSHSCCSRCYEREKEKLEQELEETKS